MKTNLRLPIPPRISAFAQSHPALYRTLVVWAYSAQNPLAIASQAPRFQVDEDGFWDFDRPLDMDAALPDDLILEQVEAGLQEQAESYHTLYPFSPAYAWPA